MKPNLTSALLAFSETEALGHIDHIIIGSGVGGLTCANILAKAGRKVLVLEQHTVAGGLSHTFERKGGFVWDVGLHYVGQMQSKGSILRTLFDYVTDGKLQWASMGDIYDRICIGGKEYFFSRPPEKLIADLKIKFPEEAQAIDAYFDLIRKTTGSAKLFFIEKAFPPLLSKLIGNFFRSPFLKIASKTTSEICSSLTQNPELRAVLCSQFGNYGLAPQESSFGMHAVVVNHYMEGGFYPVGGSGQIAKFMVEALGKKGGRVRTKAKVSKIRLEKGRVAGVEIGGFFIPCKSVISNVGAQQTFSQLVSPHSLNPKLVSIPPSMAHFGLYLGFDASAQELQLPLYNTWYYSDSNLDEIARESHASATTPLRFAYFSFPSAKDPLAANILPNKATLEGIGMANYAWFKPFESQARHKRGNSYAELKANFQSKMLEKIEQLWPQTKGHIAVCEVSTPLSTKYYMNNAQGEMYGLAHSPDRFKIKELRPQTKIKGLTLTGQDVMTGGIGSALMSGLLAAASILKFRIALRFREMYRKT